MFLLDDILLGPGKAAYVLFQELAKKAKEEWLNDEGVKHELQQLYEMLDSGGISEKDFEAQECRLLERLEEIARLKFLDKWGAPEGDSETPTLQSSASAVPLGQGSDMPTIDVEPAWSPPPALPPLPAAPPASAAAPLLPAMPPPTARPAAVAASPYSSVPPAYSSVPPPAPVAPMPEVYAPAPAAPPVPVVRPLDGGLSVNHVMACALSAVSVLKKSVSAVTSVMPSEDGWRVTVELVERRGLPDTNDLLGIYELRLDPAGHVLRYERTQMRRRGDIGR